MLPLLLISLFTLFSVPLALADGLIPIKDRGQLPTDIHLELRQERARDVENLTAPLRAALRRPIPGELESGERGGRAETDTVKVLVCLLAYHENSRPDLSTVPADGKFMAASDTIPAYLIRVDPPPHDETYFDAHMTALREFYRIQSYGKLEIEWEIAQGPHDGLFLLSDIDSLGPGSYGDDFWTLESLEHFVRTALDTIDAGLQAAHPGEAVVGQFDHVIIFHAGSDLQNDIYQDSPNDLPSFNIHFGDPDGPHLMDGGLTPLGSVVLLPETTIQDVDPADPVLGAINSVISHEFGHQLGLVDTYNTYWGWPSVGFWDLMDSGHQLLYGFMESGNPDPLFCYGALPASFSIWHRMLLNWVEVADGSLDRFGGGERDIELTACNLQGSGVKALRVDLSDDEYFILENRQEILHQGFRFVWRDPDTRVFLWVNPGDPDDVDVEYINGGEYDLFIPQSGLLAWHIDERDFDLLYPLNIINLDGDRHVRLVEADGSRDLGDPYSANWRGNDLDPFFTGNNTEWTEITNPSTRLRDKTPSGFRMTDLVTSPYITDENACDSTITFHVALSGVPEGFPRDDSALVDSTLMIQPAMGTLLPDGQWLSYFMASLDQDTLQQAHWIRSGTSLEEGPELTPVTPLFEIDDYPLGAVNLEAPLFGENAWAFMTGSQVYVQGLPQLEEPLDLPLWEMGSGGSILTGAVAGADAVTGFATDTSWLAWSAWNSVDDEVWVVLLSGAQGGVGAPDLGVVYATPSVSPVDTIPPRVRLSTIRRQRDGGGDGLFLLYVESGKMVIIDPLTQELPDTLPAPERGDQNYWVRALDLNDDGYEDPGEIFWIFEDGRVYRISADEPELIFTAYLEGESITVPPIPADLDGNGTPELFMTTGTHIYRYSLEGYLHVDWPVRLDELAYFDDPMRVGTTLRAADMTGDDISELILFTQTGHLLIFGDRGIPLLGTPRSLAGEAPFDVYTPAGQVFAVSKRGYLLSFKGTAGPEAVADWPLDAGGQWRQGRWIRHHQQDDTTGLPGEGWIIYPNPAADRAAVYHPDLPEGTDCRVELFDLEGQRRIITQGTTQAAGPWELSLELGNLAPGIYLCRVEVVSGGQKSSFVKKLGVLR